MASPPKLCLLLATNKLSGQNTVETEVSKSHCPQRYRLSLETVIASALRSSRRPNRICRNRMSTGAMRCKIFQEVSQSFAAEYPGHFWKPD